MFLKIVTTALVVCGLAMVFSIPFVLGSRPEEGGREELARYGVRVLSFFAVTCFVWIGAAMCAIVLMRRAKNEFLRDQGTNVKELIEGTLRDHERKK